MNKIEISPFLKWAGGKRWLADRHLNIFPEDYNRYIEPFFGGGAVFFKLRPKKALLSDKNDDLINTYLALKTDWEKVYGLLNTHQKRHCKSYYYLTRASKPRSNFSKAAKFIYLNRTCWNGLYRVNLKGKFNVPIGTKSRVIMPNDNFQEISQTLKNAALKAKSFQAIIKQAKKGDLIFADPPYTVKHDQNNFIKYNESLFSWEDQEALKGSLIGALKKGAKIVLTNANHKSIKDLYKDVFGFKVLKRESILAADPLRRGSVKEILFSSEF